MKSPSPRGAPTLLLIPTQIEARHLAEAGGFEPGLAIEAVCGFGPIAAAARTAQVIAALRPSLVLLIGVAGTFDRDRLPVGSAAAFDAVAIDGVGVGAGERAVAASALGFPHWPGGLGSSAPRIDERIALAQPPARATAGATARAIDPALLLSTASASGSRAHAAERLRRFPGALAEDMEGFSVALACALAGVPVSIVRGISNEVGDRDPARWRIPAALAAARRLALELLHGE